MMTVQTLEEYAKLFWAAPADGAGNVTAPFLLLPFSLGYSSLIFFILFFP